MSDLSSHTDSAPYPARIRAVRERLGDAGCDCALVTSVVNVRYLTGFTGSAALFAFTPTAEHLIVDFRYLEQAAEECSIEVTKREGALEEVVSGYLRGGRRCALEANHVTLSLLNRLAKVAGSRVRMEPAGPDAGAPASVEWRPAANLVEPVRLIKDGYEIARLRAAGRLLEDLLGRTIATIKPGMTELEVATGFEREARLATGRVLPFEPIVASGPRAALPHGVASRRPIQSGEPVILDVGLQLDGYCADMTRTIVVGSADEKLRRIHEAVHLANRTAVRALKPGMTGETAHALATGVLESSGLAQFFGHGLGHGIGIEVHEEPRLAPNVGDQLSVGMAFTVEPGVYLPGWGGVRIEDFGVLTESGFEEFTSLPRGLVVV